MRLPIIKSKDSYKRRTLVFGGINKLQAFSEGELEDCSGVSHNSFPALTQRNKEALEFECENPIAAVFGNKECIVTNSAIYYDRKEVGKLSCGNKNIAQIGNKIVIFPDKVYYDTETEKLSRLDGGCTLKNIKVSFASNKISLPDNAYEIVTTVESLVLNENKDVFRYSDVNVEEGEIIFSEAELIKAVDLLQGDVFSEKSGKGHYRTAESVKAENGEITVFGSRVTVEKSGVGAFSLFSEGDIIEISGCECASNNKQTKIVEVGENYLLFEENTFEQKNETTVIEIKRNIPDFTCVCCYKNRLWGCEGNTIYASALGDPTNFFKYNNLSTDSFSVESGDSGDFTASVVFGNYCLFFKQDKCYRLYGDRPANFQLLEAFSGGITAENARSIAEIGGKIIYKGNGGVYAFSGGNPQKISDKLGNTMLNNCIGGGIGDCYYLSADTASGREEFVYNMKHDVWSKSGIKDAQGYFSSADKLYRLMKNGVFSIENETDEECEWYAQLRPFDEEYYSTKNYSGIYITAQLFENSVIKTEISYDGDEWRTVSQHYGNKKEYINIPCPMKGCHEVRIRLSGKGKSIIESIVRKFSVGRG